MGIVVILVISVLVITNSILFYLYKNTTNIVVNNHNISNISILDIKYFMETQQCDSIHYRDENEYDNLPGEITCIKNICLQEKKFCEPEFLNLLEW